MEATPENIVTVLKEQITKTEQTLSEMGYNPASVREQVADIALRNGSPALDIGTGACACLAVTMARKGMKVTAVDHASSAVRLAEERATGTLGERLEIRYAEATRLPFSDSSYQVVTAFDALCHASKPDAVLEEMFRVSSHAVIVTELNAAGRRITQHHDGGFDEKLPELLVRLCQDCQRFDDAHHVTYFCEKQLRR